MARLDAPAKSWSLRVQLARALLTNSAVVSVAALALVATFAWWSHRERALESQFYIAEAVVARLHQRLHTDPSKHKTWVPRSSRPHELQSLHAIPHLPDVGERFFAKPNQEKTDAAAFMVFGRDQRKELWQSAVTIPDDFCTAPAGRCLIINSFGQSIFSSGVPIESALEDTSEYARPFLSSGLREGAEIIPGKSFFDPEVMVSFKQIPATNLAVVVLSPNHIFWGPAFVTAMAALGACGVILLFGIIAAWLWSQEVSEPFNRISRAVWLLGQARFDIGLPSEDVFELDTVRNGLVGAGASLRRREHILLNFIAAKDRLLTSCLCAPPSATNAALICKSLELCGVYVMTGGDWKVSVREVNIQSKKVRTFQGQKGSEPIEGAGTELDKADEKSLTIPQEPRALLALSPSAKEIQIKISDGDSVLLDVLWQTGTTFSISEGNISYVKGLFDALAVVIAARHERTAKTPASA